MTRNAQALHSSSPDKAMRVLAEPDHVFGPVTDDWAAAEAWLSTVRLKSRHGAHETEKTYRYHLAKLRWYCEHVGRVMPSRWSLQDVRHFIAFLAALPDDALCARRTQKIKRVDVHGRPAPAAFVAQGEPGWTPFQRQPSTSSQADIRRCVHAMFAKWHAAGYIRINPMALTVAGNMREVNTDCALTGEAFDRMLAVMDQAEKTTFTERQAYVRDRFILEAVRAMGLRTSELVAARMSAFMHLTLQTTGKPYWIFVASTAEGKSGRVRPVPPAVWTAFTIYRTAFGLPAVPQSGETTRLILSTRTHAVTIGGAAIRHTGSRRFFDAWREVTTRQGLYAIVKQRFAQAADALQARGDAGSAAQLRRASTHWLRRTFTKSALRAGDADMATTMRYTQQEMQDLITAWEQANPGSVV